MKLNITIFTLFLFFGLSAQSIADFENFNLPVDTFLNGSDGSGGFSNNALFLPNTYNAMFESWTDWAISTKTDTITPGFINQFSAAPGTGAENTSTYAVSAAFAPTQIQLTGDAAGKPVDGLYITNSTYAKLSMQEGDAFAKRFGGETGDDPDFFLLTIQKYFGGELGTEVIEFYLADFRFEDNSQDFILDTWNFVDLTPLGNVDSLVFSLSSSDNGQFGMNTPAFFCIDQVTTAAMSTSTEEIAWTTFEVYPNPTKDYLRINWSEQATATVNITNSTGQIMQTHILGFGTNEINIAPLPKGIYFVNIADRVGWKTELIQKL